jgi:hypothetical protein
LEDAAEEDACCGFDCGFDAVLRGAALGGSLAFARFVVLLALPFELALALLGFDGLLVVVLAMAFPLLWLLNRLEP